MSLQHKDSGQLGSIQLGSILLTIWLREKMDLCSLIRLPKIVIIWVLSEKCDLIFHILLSIPTNHFILLRLAGGWQRKPQENGRLHNYKPHFASLREQRERKREREMKGRARCKVAGAHTILVPRVFHWGRGCLKRVDLATKKWWTLWKTQCVQRLQKFGDMIIAVMWN